jgi:hypothetical protein
MTTFTRCLNPTCPCREPVPAATCPQGRDCCRPNTPCMSCIGWIAYTCRLTGTLDNITFTYSWDGSTQPSRAMALDAGFRDVGSDDFNVGRIEDDCLVWHGWMGEEHPADERAEVAVALGLRLSDDAPAVDDPQASAAASGQTS